MKRRTFMKSAAAASVPFVWSVPRADAMAPPSGKYVLIETAHFADIGGWSLDSQLIEQMGAPHLLAHGLGIPVADASTIIQFPHTGKYRLWVRTRNWCPGPWEAPGRFQVRIGNVYAKREFGSNPTGSWNWEDGGVVDITSQEIRIFLHDLTGFDGRCDALLLVADITWEPATYTDDGTGLRAALIPEKNPEEILDVDLVIVGGGISGCAAALAAGERGAKVALIHERSIFGGNASSEIRVHTEGIVGYGGKILNRINTVHWPNGSPDSKKDQRKRATTMESAPNVRLFSDKWMCAVKTEGGRIIHVDALEHFTGRLIRFRAPLFIDCTGDGWLGYKAGADYRIGRESFTEFDEQWEEHGDLWSPQISDGLTMGASLLWYSREEERSVAFPDVPWAMPVALDNAAIFGDWIWEYAAVDIHPVNDIERIRDHMFRAIYGSFSNAKRNPVNANRTLDWVGFLLGKRESRRLMGDYIYSMRDMIENRRFHDTVAEEIRDVDVHYQRVLSGGKYDFLSQALFRKVDRYYIPFRCLYSRNIVNLMMAGRCFSCSHVGLGGPRVMHTCGQMGIATGYAAAIGLEKDKSPREVGGDHIEELAGMIHE